MRHPRRISGPAPALAGAGAGTAAPPAMPVRRRAVDAPPARRTRAARSSAHRRAVHRAPGIALRVVDAVASASESPLLDRLIRSRTWIGLLAFSLIGIVAMQLLVLRLNTDVGRQLARAAALQRQNTLTSIADSQASSGAVIEPAAAAAGMTMAMPGSLRFLTVGRSDVARAAGALAAPISSAPPGEATSGPAGAAAISSEAAAAPSEAATAPSEAMRSSPGAAAAPSETTSASSEAMRSSAEAAPSSAATSTPSGAAAAAAEARSGAAATAGAAQAGEATRG